MTFYFFGKFVFIQITVQEQNKFTMSLILYKDLKIAKLNTYGKENLYSYSYRDHFSR